MLTGGAFDATSNNYVWGRGIFFDNADLFRNSTLRMEVGKSVRCIRD